MKLSADKIPLENCLIITLMERVEGFEFVDAIIEKADKKVEDFQWDKKFIYLNEN